MVITQAVNGPEQQRIGGTHTASDATVRPLRQAASLVGRCSAGCAVPPWQKPGVAGASNPQLACCLEGRALALLGEPLGSAIRARTSEAVQVRVTQTGEQRTLGVPKGWPKDQGKKQRSGEPWGWGLGSWAVGTQRPLGRSLMPFHVCACLGVTLFLYAVLFSPLKWEDCFFSHKSERE